MTQSYVSPRFCIHCDKEQPTHTETLRCQACGRVTAETDIPVRVRQPLAGSSPNGLARADVPKPEKLVLQETPQLRRWIDQTKALADTFQERATKSLGFAEQFQTEAKQLQMAAQAFAGLLRQIGIEPRPRHTESADGAEPQRYVGRPMPPGKWARAHDACVKCGRTDRKHKAHGLCSGCWNSGLSK